MCAGRIQAISELQEGPWADRSPETRRGPWRADGGRYLVSAPLLIALAAACASPLPRPAPETVADVAPPVVVTPPSAEDPTAVRGDSPATDATSDLFALPWVVDPRLSPDGRWLTWRVPGAPGELRLRPLDGDGGDVVLPAAGAGDEVTAYAWHAGSDGLSVLRREGDGSRVEVVALAGADGSATARQIFAASDAEVSLVADLQAGDGVRVLVGVRRPAADEHLLLTVDVESAEVAEIGRGGGDLERWWVDAGGVPRAAELRGLDGSWRLVPVVDGRPAAPLLACTADETCLAQSLGPDGRLLTVLTDRGTATRLESAQVDLATGSLEPIAELGPTSEPPGRTGDDSELVSSSADGRLALVADSAGALLLVDREDGVAQEVMRLRPSPDLIGHALHRRPLHSEVRYVARDGLSIPARLTLPGAADPVVRAAATSRPGLPRPSLPAAVVLPPDDPWSPPPAGRRPLVEMLADLGYVVLQPSPRGSAGYGPDFRVAGDRQWGGAMLDDLADGVAWLVEEGVVDPDRVAIVGLGWGGYATVAALAFTPDLYAAGVAMGGPVDLVALVDGESDPVRASVLRRRVGDPDHHEQRQRLRRHSPLAHAGAIRAPLLRIDLEGAGWSDPEGSARLVAVLRHLGRPVEALAVAGGSGRLEGPAGALVAAEIERFLAFHLGGRGAEVRRADDPGQAAPPAIDGSAAEPVSAGAGP